VLADSLTEHHPGERLHVLVTDDRDRAVDPAAEPFELCRPGEVTTTSTRSQPSLRAFRVWARATSEALSTFEGEIEP
jgi:hypothetical protein